MSRENTVLDVGDKAPHFELPDSASGELVKLSDYAGQALMIYFGRGTWWPHCREYMGHIQGMQSELDKRGVKVLVILAERQQHIKEYLEEHPYPYPVLSDKSREVSKEYGVYVRVNFESVHIARPSTFILDPEGVIRYIFVASVQTEYPDDAGIYAVMDAM